MPEILRGGVPLTFRSGDRQCHETLQHVYAKEGVYVVPNGHVLVVSVYGPAPSGGRSERREFPAGTRFRLVRSGSVYQRAVTEIL
jgi:hypothetical protein